MKNACEMCLMPFAKDPGERESEHYCSYCYKDGVLLGEQLSLKEFQQISYESMRKSDIAWPMAKFYTFCIRFAPYWKNKK